jgi:serine/threonine protein kinase
VAPRNILFDLDWDAVDHDGPGNPVICDFGMSRQSDLGQHQKTVGLKIPVRWSAPEVFGHIQQYFFASDVWSMGVVVWQLLTQHEDPYPDVIEGWDVVQGLQNGTADLRISLPNAPQWAALSVRFLQGCHDGVAPFSSQLFYLVLFLHLFDEWWSGPKCNNNTGSSGSVFGSDCSPPARSSSVGPCRKLATIGLVLGR